MLNAEEVDHLLQNAAEEEGNYGDVYVQIYYEDDTDLEDYLPFSYEVVESKGEAFEGAFRSNLSLVLRVTFNDGSSKLFRKLGKYESFNGAYFEGKLHEVRPAQVVVDTYEPI